MTIKSLKSTAAKLLTAGLLAGAVALAVPAKADAQVIVFAGTSRAGLPVYAHYDGFRAEEFRRHEEWRRERFDHRFYGRYGGRYQGRFYR